MNTVKELQKKKAELDAQIALLEAQTAHDREDEIAKGIAEIHAVMNQYRLNAGNIFKAKSMAPGSATTGHKDDR